MEMGSAEKFARRWWLDGDAGCGMGSLRGNVGVDDGGELPVICIFSRMNGSETEVLRFFGYVTQNLRLFVDCKSCYARYTDHSFTMTSSCFQSPWRGCFRAPEHGHLHSVNLTSNHTARFTTTYLLL